MKNLRRQKRVENREKIYFELWKVGKKDKVYRLWNYDWFFYQLYFYESSVIEGKKNVMKALLKKVQVLSSIVMKALLKLCNEICFSLAFIFPQLLT